MFVCQRVGLTLCPSEQLLCDAGGSSLVGFPVAGMGPAIAAKKGSQDGRGSSRGRSPVLMIGGGAVSVCLPHSPGPAEFV